MSVWVLLTSHRHGTDVSVHQSEEGAVANLAGYVRQCWDDEIGRVFSQLGVDAVMPDNDQEAISKYFEAMSSNEFYSIEQTELLP